MLKEHVQRGADRRAASSDRSVDVAGHQRAAAGKPVFRSKAARRMLRRQNPLQVVILTMA